jgi:hypothetical protein
VADGLAEEVSDLKINVVDLQYGPLTREQDFDIEMTRRMASVWIEDLLSQIGMDLDADEG